jgi:hypothetical protein
MTVCAISGKKEDDTSSRWRSPTEEGELTNYEKSAQLRAYVLIVYP